jgi:MFS family permease
LPRPGLTEIVKGFLIIFAKFSDIFGAKFMLLLALLIFTVFSIACGAATAMTEL